MVLIGACAPRASAQYTGDLKVFFGQQSMKNYAIGASDPGSGFEHYLAAGTLWPNRPRLGLAPTKAVHWMQVDAAGTTLISKVFDDPVCEESVVGVHGLPSGNALIVAARFDLNLFFPPHGIEILTVDPGGTLLSTRVIETTDPVWNSLFPHGTLLYNSDELFICGSVGESPTGMPPMGSSTAAAFILKYDLPSASVVGITYFETGGGSPDMDMALRMKVVREGIWVGGSGNDPQGPMMDRVIDPATLATVRDHPFGVTPASGSWESSFDIVETADGDRFIFGNTYGLQLNALSNVYAHVTVVDGDLRPYPGRSRYRMQPFDDLWGNVVLNDRLEGQDVLMSGFAMHRGCDNGTFPTSPDNIDPILVHLQLKRNGDDIDVTPKYWNTILSAEGTGNHISNPLSYYRLGGAPASPLWAPISTVREPFLATELVMACPMWNANVSPERLNMKFVRADDVSGSVFGCDGTSECNFIGSVEPVTLGAQSGDNTIGLTAGWINLTDAVLAPDNTELCSKRYKSIAQGTDGGAAIEMVTDLSPNPARDHITIAVEAEPEGLFRITLTDMAGKQVADLYHGTASGLASIALPSLAPGTYLVQVDRADEHLGTRLLLIER